MTTKITEDSFTFTDCADDEIRFANDYGELTVCVNDGVEVLIPAENALEIIQFLNKHFAEKPKALEQVGDVVLDSRDLPPSFVLNVTGNVTINH